MGHGRCEVEAPAERQRCDAFLARKAGLSLKVGFLTDYHLGFHWARPAHPNGNHKWSATIEGVAFFRSPPGLTILMLEGRQENERESAWYYCAVRLSISDLNVDYKGDRVWTSLRDDPNGAFGNKDNTYGLIRDRVIDELPPSIEKPAGDK